MRRIVVHSSSYSGIATIHNVVVGLIFGPSPCEALMHRQASMNPSNVLPASPMKQRKRRLNLAGNIENEERRHRAAQHDADAADDAVARERRQAGQRDERVERHGAREPIHAVEHVEGIDGADDGDAGERRRRPARRTATSESPKGRPSVVIDRSADVASTRSAATRCAVSRAIGEISKRSSSKPTSTTSAAADSKEAETNWLVGSRPMPNTQPMNIARPPTTGISP